jgi:hypothetical protein
VTPPTPRRAARFLATFAAGLGLALALTATLNWLVDPFLLLGRPRVAGFNAVKPDYRQRQWIAKADALVRLAPVTAVFGTSRVERGFDPQAPVWPAAARPVFNAGVPGASLFATVRTFQHAASTGRLRTALVVLELETFLPGSTSRTDFLRRQPTGERRFRVDAAGAPQPGHGLQRVLDRASALLTLQALGASLRTIALQRSPLAADIADDGFNPLPQAAAELAQVGHHWLFAAKMGEVVAQLRGDRCPAPGAPSTVPEAFALLDLMLATARREGVRLVLLLPPHHADYLLAIRAAGLWGHFADWRRALAVRVAREPAGTVELWDFTGFTELHTEPVPPPGDRRSRMRWHLEPSHFTAALGELVLARIFAAAADLPEGFGVRLLPATVEAHLAAQGRDLARLAPSAEARYGPALLAQPVTACAPGDGPPAARVAGTGPR